jgi:hypothetical protein
MASKVLEGCLILKEIVGGSRLTVLSEETHRDVFLGLWIDTRNGKNCDGARNITHQTTHRILKLLLLQLRLGEVNRGILFLCSFLRACYVVLLQQTSRIIVSWGTDGVAGTCVVGSVSIGRGAWP